MLGSLSFRDSGIQKRKFEREKKKMIRLYFVGGVKKQQPILWSGLTEIYVVKHECVQVPRYVQKQIYECLMWMWICVCVQWEWRDSISDDKGSSFSKEGSMSDCLIWCHIPPISFTHERKQDRRNIYLQPTNGRTKRQFLEKDPLVNSYTCCPFSLFSLICQFMIKLTFNCLFVVITCGPNLFLSLATCIVHIYHTW